MTPPSVLAIAEYVSKTLLGTSPVRLAQRRASRRDRIPPIGPRFRYERNLSLAALSGVLGALLVTGQTLNISSFVAAIMMVGIVGEIDKRDAGIDLVLSENSSPFFMRRGGRN